jgi:ATP-dependent 26S proteasome regulatory subunit
MSDYKGHKGALQFIYDITDDYDGYNTVEGLKSLIDEIREEVLSALKLGDKYNKE